MHIHSLKRAAVVACALAVLAAPAGADAVTTKLRVEADGKDIGPGFNYVHDAVRYETSTACGGSGDAYTLDGPTALGLLFQAADFTRKLRPVQVSDEFDFGKFVCGVGGYEGNDAGTAYWSYKVDHVLPEIGADQFAINRSHDEVLWFFVNGTSNWGNELEIIVREQVVKAGKPVQLTVRQYDANGTASPAAGVRLSGAGGEVTGPNGKARVVFDEAGKPSVRGVRAGDIATDRVDLCVWEDAASECDRWLTGWVVGTDADDRIGGTDDPERITGRRGDDRINSRGDGKADSVRCGPGEDVVRADELDRVKGNCETVKR